MKRFFSLTLLHKVCIYFIRSIRILHSYTKFGENSSGRFQFKNSMSIQLTFTVLRFYTKPVETLLNPLTFKVLYFYTKSVETSLDPLLIFYIITLLHKKFKTVSLSTCRSQFYTLTQSL